MEQDSSIVALTRKILKLHENNIYRFLENKKLRERIKNLKNGLNQTKVHQRAQLAQLKIDYAVLNVRLKKLQEYYENSQNQTRSG